MSKRTWRKLGLIYAAAGERHPKLLSHAANPLALHKTGDIYRVFYSGRDANNRSSVGAVDIDIVKNEIVAEHYSPFLVHGDLDSFFSDGISIGNHFSVNGVTYILFMGWQNPSDGHWRGDIGTIQVTPLLELTLLERPPIFSQDNIDPISFSYPCVSKFNDGFYDMWYGSTLDWSSDNGEMIHVINHAYSDDGINWVKTGLAVPYQLNYAQAFSRPTVIENSKHGLDMWFSYRCGTGQKYRIGYAHNNGLGWKLDLENSGIDVSETGWDSEMIEYPFVFKHKDNIYMLYNGNGYGRTGFGIAVLEEN